MTTIKKSFLIHLDSLDVLDHLTDEQSGQLLKAFKSFHKGDEIELNPMLEIAFVPFKNQFTRDLETYENVCNRNKINGMKGGRPKTQKTQVVLEKTQRNPKKPKKPDKDNDSDNKKDSDKDNKKGNGRDKDITVAIKNINDLNYTAFHKYISYRKEAGIKKLTKHGEELAAKKLVKIGGDKQMEVVEQSIGNGWSGLFELKNQITNKKQTKIDSFNEWLDSSNNAIDGECDVIN